MSVNCTRNLLEYATNKEPNKKALIFKEDSLTYKELLEKVNQLSNYLSKLDLPKGSRVGIYSNKSIEQVISILAIFSTDFVFVPITRMLKPDQIDYIVKDCDIKIIITQKNKLENIKNSGFNGKIITYEKDDYHDSIAEIYKYHDKEFSSTVKSFHNATIIYSFASSGLPKGVVITHRNLVDGARIVTRYLKLQKDDVISGVLSFNLDYGINQIVTSIYNLSTLALHQLVLPSDFFNHLTKDKVTILPVMPIHITKMFDDEPHRLPTPEQLKNIKTITSSGGKLTTKMLQDIENFFSNAKFYSMHGLSEAFRSAYLEPSQLKIRPTSIGKAVPDVELFVINEDGKECKPREVGELIHRGACIYKGYWNSKEDTNLRYKSIDILKNVINLEGDLTDEIVVASGDYVYKDEEGYIYFHSRKDNMIKTMGYRVSPHEVEQVVYDNFSQVNSCVVFGMEDEKIEEKIVLVYSSSSQIPQDEILFELKKHLPSYMIPSIIVYKRSIPLHYGKVDTNSLKEELVK